MPIYRWHGSSVTGARIDWMTDGGKVTFYIVSITISMKKLVTEPAYDDTEVDVTKVDG